jgi:hypothetical protein
MNGDAYAGRLNGERPLSLTELEGARERPSGSDPSAETDRSFLSSSAACSPEDFSALEVFGRRKEINFGSTETMSPGARRVFAF